MSNTRSIDKYLRPLLNDSIEIIYDLLKDTKYTKTVKIPIFKDDHLISIKEESRIDYHKLSRAIQHKTDLSTKASFKIARNTLEARFANKLGIDEEIDKRVIEQLTNLIAQFAKDITFCPSSAMKKSLTAFSQHLDYDLMSFLYVIPLYNIKGNFSSMRLSEDLHIRRITRNEYSEIIHLKNTLFKDITSYQRQLKFVMVCRISESSKDSLAEAIQKCVFATNLLRLLKGGFPQFGRMYSFDSEYMDVGKIVPILHYYESSIMNGSSIMLTKQDAKQFSKFYADIQKILTGIKKPEFLINSIERFGKALRHKNASNQIVDYVISIESILASSPGESRLKLAHRVSALCGNTDIKRLWLWEFMKEAYGFRSGMVHSSEERNFKIQSKCVEPKQISDHMYKITRISILRIMYMLHRYSKQSDIIDELDRSMYDRNRLKKLEQLWKKHKV